MILRETPYIKLNRDGRIDYCSAWIKSYKYDSNYYTISYNTVIGIFTKDSTGNKIYLETAGSYSQTTASKHKPRAAAIANYNNFKIVDDIKPEVLHGIYTNPDKYNVDEILQESQERRQILNALYNNDNNAPAILDAKYKSVITACKEPETTQYKNGNSQTKYYYKTNFKYCSQIYYEVNQKHTQKTITKGSKGKFKTYNITCNIVNISY